MGVYIWASVLRVAKAKEESEVVTLWSIHILLLLLSACLCLFTPSSAAITPPCFANPHRPLILLVILQYYHYTPSPPPIHPVSYELMEQLTEDASYSML